MIFCRPENALADAQIYLVKGIPGYQQSGLHALSAVTLVDGRSVTLGDGRFRCKEAGSGGSAIRTVERVSFGAV
jgi:hypothetical protein